jgi:Secretion system C-terminal sorting domain
VKNSTLVLTPLPYVNTKIPGSATGVKKLFYCLSLLVPLWASAADPSLSANANSKYGNSQSAGLTAPLGTTESIRTNLFLLQPDNTTIIADGVYTEYNNLYHDSVTMEDAGKMTNMLENLGLVRYGKTLSVERRPIINANDTLFYKLWKTTKRNYQIEIITSLTTNKGLQAFFTDSYLNTTTPLALGGAVKINFSVNDDKASAAVNRFKIIFRSLPAAFTSAKAYRQGNKVAVDWKIENEKNITGYEVEKSVNGKDYTKIKSMPVKGTGDYLYVDDAPAKGYIFYRIKSIINDGSAGFISVLNVEGISPAAGINIYPNPVKDNTINIQMSNQPEGVYQVKLINNTGQVVYSSKVGVKSNNTSQSFFTGNHIPKGVYHLEVKAAASPAISKTVLLQ